MNEEEKGIQQLVERFTEAWNNHDAKAFSLVFADDADFTNVFGQKAHGRAAIEKFHSPIFSTVFRNSYFNAEEVSIRFINPGLAAVDTRWQMSGATDPQGNPWADRKGLMNLLVKKEDNLWLILIMHNMDLPTAPSPLKL